MINLGKDCTAGDTAEHRQTSSRVYTGIPFIPVYRYRYRKRKQLENPSLRLSNSLCIEGDT